MRLTLRQTQSLFARKVADLIIKAHDLGYEITLGDAYRDPRIPRCYGVANSFHKKRLAIDINLFKDGKYLINTEDHKQLGEWWESQGGTWGGRFKIPDGNHYSWGESR